MRANSFCLLYMAIARQLVKTGKGRKITGLLFWVWGVWDCHSVSNRFWSLVSWSAWKKSLSFPLGAAQTVQICIGIKLGFHAWIWNLVWVFVLSAYRTVSLASGAHRWCDVGVWGTREAACFRLLGFVSFLFVLCVNSCWVMMYLFLMCGWPCIVIQCG